MRACVHPCDFQLVEGIYYNLLLLGCCTVTADLLLCAIHCSFGLLLSPAAVAAAPPTQVCGILCMSPVRYSFLG